MKIETIKYQDLTAEKLLELGECFWGQEYDEVYRYSDIEDAIEDILDSAILFSEPVEVIAAKPIPITEKEVNIQQVLEDILEELDQKHGDPDDWSVKPTEAMKIAADALAKVIVAEYKSWTCETVLVVRLDNPLEWVRDNRPDWLEED